MPQITNEYVEQRNGGYYVADTRVSLDSVLHAFRHGESPEKILEHFPAIGVLAKVYGAIAFALDHPREMDAYLTAQRTTVGRGAPVKPARHRGEGAPSSTRKDRPVLKARLLADADLNAGIVDGIRARISEIDFQIAQALLPDRSPDPKVLAFAADQRRVLVSHDVNTMPQHFREFIREQQSPGLILIPQRLSIGAAIDELQLVWECNDEENS